MKVLLKGYYGFKNFGDDVLMLVTFNISKELFPNAQFYIYSENSNNNQYIKSFLSHNVSIVDYRCNEHFDLIIHGGGGVHFDFNKGNIFSLGLNSLIKVLGVNLFLKIFKFYLKLLKRNRATFDKRIGIGIGIGTFTKSSKNFYNHLETLNTYNALLVRDKESKKNLAPYKFKYPIEVFSDLAFLIEKWMPENRLENTININKKIALILRDWNYDNNNYFNHLLAVCKKLKNHGFEIECFALDIQKDLKFIETFSKEYTMNIWDPEHAKLNDYLLKLKNMDLIITSRAHGAIVGACLGRPSICIEIEPKLKIVSTMLSNSSHIISNPFKENELFEKAIYTINNIEKFNKGALDDLETNNNIMKKALERFKELIKL